MNEKLSLAMRLYCFFYVSVYEPLKALGEPSQKQMDRWDYEEEALQMLRLILWTRHDEMVERGEGSSTKASDCLELYSAITTCQYTTGWRRQHMRRRILARGHHYFTPPFPSPKARSPREERR